MMFPSKDMPNIGDIINILGKEYKTGVRLEITFNYPGQLRSDVDEKRIGYLIGSCPANELYPDIYSTIDKIVVLSSTDPITVEPFSKKIYGASDTNQKTIDIFEKVILSIDELVKNNN